MRLSEQAGVSVAQAAQDFATLKTEAVEDAHHQTRQQAETSIFSYLESFYNAKRRHSSLRFLSPNDFERVHFAQVA